MIFSNFLELPFEEVTQMGKGIKQEVQRVVCVTGANKGIGKGIAERLASDGMKVVIAARTRVEETAEELREAGGDAYGIPVDISDGKAVVELFKKIEKDIGPLWLLVNNAGALRTGPTVDLKEEDWDAVFNVNAKGTFLCSREAIRHMMRREEGRIVCISSIAGFIVRTEQISYNCAKAAVIHFVRSLAVEMAPHGITVNCLCPGMTKTDLLMKSAKERNLNLDAMIKRIPAGKMAKPADHGGLVSYLASDDAAHVNGQIISVDGAQSMYMPLQ